jgi:hypothetical protein
MIIETCAGMYQWTCPAQTELMMMMVMMMVMMR